MDIQGSSSDLLRVDYSRTNQYVGPEPVKLTFGEKLKKGFAKFGSYFGSLVSTVAPIFGPLGMITGAAAYGLKNISNRSLSRMTAKEQYDLATQPQPMSVALLGFMDDPQPQVQPFVAPSHLQPSIEDVVIQSQQT